MGRLDPVNHTESLITPDKPDINHTVRKNPAPPRPSLTDITAVDVQDADSQKHTSRNIASGRAASTRAFAVLSAEEMIRVHWGLQRHARQSQPNVAEAGRADPDRATAFARTTIRRNTAELRRIEPGCLVPEEPGLHPPRPTNLQAHFHLTSNRRPTGPCRTRKRDRKTNPDPPGMPDSTAVAKMERHIYLTPSPKQGQSQLLHRRCRQPCRMD